MGGALVYFEEKFVAPPPLREKSRRFFVLFCVRGVAAMMRYTYHEKKRRYCCLAVRIDSIFSRAARGVVAVAAAVHGLSYRSIMYWGVRGA